MSKQSPPKIGDDYGAWKKEIKVSELGTEVAGTKQAPTVIGVLGGDYKTVAMEMSLDEMKKEDGLNRLIPHVDVVFEKDKNYNAYEKYVIFEDIRRAHGEEIGEFMIRFDRAMKQTKAIEIVYPDNVLAFKLMRSMGGGGGFNPKKPKPKMGFQTIFGFFGCFGFFGVFFRKRCGKYLSQHS